MLCRHTSMIRSFLCFSFLFFFLLQKKPSEELFVCHQEMMNGNDTRLPVNKVRDTENSYCWNVKLSALWPIWGYQVAEDTNPNHEYKTECHLSAQLLNCEDRVRRIVRVRRETCTPLGDNRRICWNESFIFLVWLEKHRWKRVPDLG